MFQRGVSLQTSCRPVPGEVVLRNRVNIVPSIGPCIRKVVDVWDVIRFTSTFRNEYRSTPKGIDKGRILGGIHQTLTHPR